jgi:hypothetical protein
MVRGVMLPISGDIDGMRFLKASYFLLVGTALVLFVANLTLPFVESAWLSDVELRLRDFDGYGAIVRISGIFAAIFYFGIAIWGLASLVGLLWFSKAARTGYLVLVIFSLIFQLAGGVRVMPSYDVFLYGALSTVDGVILTMAYISAISEQFQDMAEQSVFGW